MHLNKNAGLYFALFLSFLIFFAGFILHDYPLADVASRYAPMAESFAEGNWKFAFHPRIQMLQPVCSGIICFLTGFDGFMSGKIASALWHFGSAVLLWMMLRDIYRKSNFIALAGTVFYLWYPYAFHIGISGLRDSAKIAVLILIAWGLAKVIRNTRASGGYFMLGTGCALAMLIRCDTIMTGLACLFTGMVIECRERKFPLYSLPSAALTAVFMSAGSAVNRYISGGAMPDYRFIKFFDDLTGQMPEFTDFLLILGAILLLMLLTSRIAAVCVDFLGLPFVVELLILSTVIISLHSASTATPQQVEHFFSELSKGFYHFAGLFILLTVLIRWQQNKLKAEEVMLILVVLINALLNILPMQIFHKVLYIPSRYLYTALPLLSGFFIIGIQMAYSLLHKYLPDKWCRLILYSCCFAIAGGCLFHDFQMIYRDYKRPSVRRDSAMQLTEMIRSDYDGPAQSDVKIKINVYKSNKRPRVFIRELSRITVTAYLAGGSLADWYRDADYVVSCDGPGKSPVKLKFIGKTNVPGQPEFSLWRVVK